MNYILISIISLQLFALALGYSNIRLNPISQRSSHTLLRNNQHHSIQQSHNQHHHIPSLYQIFLSRRKNSIQQLRLRFSNLLRWLGKRLSTFLLIASLLFGGHRVSAVGRGQDNQQEQHQYISRDKGTSHTSTAVSSTSYQQRRSTQQVAKARETAARFIASSSRRQQKDAFHQVQEAVEEYEKVVEIEVGRSWHRLALSLQGVKLDSIIMLVATSAIIPLFKRLNTSPILGFLLAGTLLGPGGLNLVNDVHMIDSLGELGIVFFLFEMGLELSLERLVAMKKDVLGLGSSQFILTSLVGMVISMTFGQLSIPAAVTVGGSLALSSSAFVLQLLKDRNAMGTRHGKSSFGILLFQDLAVVPLLVIVELLGEGSSNFMRALSLAGLKAIVTLSTMSFLGKRLLNPIFSQVAKSRSEEAFLSIILTTVLLMSFVTQGIGLSDTLGAFLAGILLSETSYRYQIEGDIAPFRGLLLGFFFMTVGFNVDLGLCVREAKTILMLLASLIIGKSAIITVLSLAFGLPLAAAQLCGFLNSQAGEFAFVSLGIAERTGIISSKVTKLLLTTVALSMGLTPMLAELGTYLSKKIESNQGFTHYTGKDAASALEVGGSTAGDHAHDESGGGNFVFICGYGKAGKLIGDVLDRRFIRYIALDNSPQKAIDARNKGLPVFFGDINRPEMLKHFNIGSAKACVITFDDISATNKAVIRLRKLYPELPIIVRAKNPQHQQRLESMFDNVYAINPVIPEDSVLLLLPFGGAVLDKIGVSAPETEAILEDVRKLYMEDNKEDDEQIKKNGGVYGFKFLEVFKRNSGTTVATTKPQANSMSGGLDWTNEEEKEDLDGFPSSTTAWDDTLLLKGASVETTIDSIPINSLVKTNINDSTVLMEESNISFPAYGVGSSSPIKEDGKFLPPPDILNAPALN